MAQRAVSLLHQGKERITSSEVLEGDKPPLAPDQELESNWIYQEPYSFCQFVRIEHRMSI